MSQEAVEEDAGPIIEGDADTGPPEPDPLPNGWQMVIRELVQTERAYVNDISDVISGYFDYRPAYYKPTECLTLPMSAEERDALFGNLKELAEFNSTLLSCFEAADGQPDEVAECFLTQLEEFKIYALYCTNYVQAMNTFNLLQKRAGAERYFQHCQLALGHTLPLDSFLLKPVQRVLKYPLLLSSLIKQYAKFATSREATRQRLLNAHKAMSNLAQYINEVKQAQEEKKRTGEILSRLIGWNNRLDTGWICVEDQIRVFGVKGEQHHLYAFQNMLLIVKPMKDCPALFRRHLFYGDLTLADVSSHEPLLFELHCPKEQVEQATVARSATRLFPIVVCPRSAKQKALWLRTLGEMGVPDVTLGVEAARRKNGEGAGGSPLSPNGMSRPRQSFIQVISQVQRAASLNSYGCQGGHLSHFRSAGRQSESDLLSAAATVGKVCSTEGVFAADSDHRTTTRRKWEELVSSVRQASESPPPASHRRSASPCAHKEKSRSPHFWRKASSMDKMNGSSSKSELSGGIAVKSESSEPAFVERAPRASSMHLSLRITSAATSKTTSVTSLTSPLATVTSMESSMELSHALLEQSHSSPGLKRSASISAKSIDFTSSLPVHQSDLESPMGSLPVSPLSNEDGAGKKLHRNRSQIRDALKSAGKLITPKRLHTHSASRLEFLSPTSDSDTTSHLGGEEQTSGSTSSFGSDLRPDDIDASFSPTSATPTTPTTSGRRRSGSITFHLPVWASSSPTAPTKPQVSKTKRASEPLLMKTPNLKMEGEPIPVEPLPSPDKAHNSRLSRLAEKTRERRNSISNYCSLKKGSHSLPGSTDFF